MIAKRKTAASSRLHKVRAACGVSARQQLRRLALGSAIFLLSAAFLAERAIAQPFYYGRITKIQEGLFWIELPGIEANRSGYFLSPPEAIELIKGRQGTYTLRYLSAQITAEKVAAWSNEICSKLNAAVASAAITKQTKRRSTLAISCG